MASDNQPRIVDVGEAIVAFLAERFPTLEASRAVIAVSHAMTLMTVALSDGRPVDAAIDDVAGSMKRQARELLRTVQQ